MAAGDWVACYSPKHSYNGNEALQAFTAIGQVAGDEVYQHWLSDDFMPYRRDVNYHKCKETPIAPLIDQLDFITNKKSWGYQFRLGFFEIGKKDFDLIRSEMMDTAVVV